MGGGHLLEQEPLISGYTTKENDMCEGQKGGMDGTHIYFKGIMVGSHGNRHPTAFPWAHYTAFHHSGTMVSSQLPQDKAAGCRDYEW